MIETLESRMLLSGAESASAQLQLLSTTGTAAHPVFNYAIKLTNTGPTNIGTFWFAWVPGEDFLPSAPLSETSPAGWGNASGTSSTPFVTGADNSFDGSAIQWVAQSAGAALTPGNSLNGFDFSSPDSPAKLDGASPTHSPTPVLTSFVYIAAPETDLGDEFVVTEASAPVVSTTLVPTIGKSTIPSQVVGGTKTNATVSVNVKNQTAATIKGKTTVELFATTDGVIDGSATLIGSVTHTLSIGATRSAAVSVKVTPALVGLAAGSYTVLARAIDHSGNSTDSTTGPTVTIAAPFISLSESFTAMTLPATLTPGAKTHATATLRITNGGNIPSGLTKITLFASTDGLIDGTATKIQTVPKALHVEPGKSMTLSLPIKLFPAVAAGQYFIVAQATDSQQHTTSAVAATTVTVS